jgi:chemotaxis signal transduction protein
MALPLEKVVEVGSLPVITSLPNVPGWILGIANIRSEIVAVADLLLFLNLPQSASIDCDRFVIVRHKEIKVGIPIDQLLGAANKSIGEQNIPLPDEFRQENATYFSAGNIMVDEQVYGILNIERFISSPHLCGFL